MFSYTYKVICFAKKISSVYLIFVFWDAFEFLIIYLFLVETKGLTLEEIEDVSYFSPNVANANSWQVFQHPNPRTYSVKHRVSTRNAAIVAE